MTKVPLTIITLLLLQPAIAQYYIRGEVRDGQNNYIQNVKIYRPSTRSIYYSGFTGGFGIPSSELYDSLVFSKEGYRTVGLRLKTNKYQKIIMEPYEAPVVNQKHNVVSLTTGDENYVNPITYFNGETYSNLVENDFVKNNKKAQTSFGLRIDKASYSNIRRFLYNGIEVPPDAVRIEEMLNYFNFNYKEPPGNQTFSISSHLTICPWDVHHQLLFLDVSARKLNLDSLPPGNFVFLIDVSGSMDMPNRLPLLKEAFQLLVSNLRARDTVSIVVYGGRVGVWLPPTGGNEKERINNAIQQLSASGATPGESAIRTAYKVARSTFIKDGNNRIILATDGDFNIGQNSEKELEQLITEQRKSGVSLTCLGVGMGNYKDSKIEVLAEKGNGNFAYIDGIHEAEKILVEEFAQTAYAVADNVTVSVKFNPQIVEEYRLIGYDNKRSAYEENEVQLEGGVIGSGASNTIVFELITDSQSNLLPSKNALASITINYQIHGDTLFHNLPYQCDSELTPFNQLDSSLRVAAAVTMFGLKLKKSKYIPEMEWPHILNVASSAVNPEVYLQQQFMEMINKAQEIYDPKKRKRRRD